MSLTGRTTLYSFHTVILTSHGGNEIVARTMFDTGSEVDLISRHFVTRHGLTDSVMSSCSPRALAGFNGAVTIANFEVRLIWIFQPESPPRALSCYVVDLPVEGPDLLLGSTFLQKHSLLLVRDSAMQRSKRPLAYIRATMNGNLGMAEILSENKDRTGRRHHLDERVNRAIEAQLGSCDDPPPYDELFRAESGRPLIQAALGSQQLELRASAQVFRRKLSIYALEVELNEKVEIDLSSGQLGQDHSISKECADIRSTGDTIVELCQHFLKILDWYITYKDSDGQGKKRPKEAELKESIKRFDGLTNRLVTSFSATLKAHDVTSGGTEGHIATSNRPATPVNGVAPEAQKQQVHQHKDLGQSKSLFQNLKEKHSNISLKAKNSTSSIKSKLEHLEHRLENDDHKNHHLPDIKGVVAKKPSAEPLQAKAVEPSVGQHASHAPIKNTKPDQAVGPTKVHKECVLETRPSKKSLKGEAPNAVNPEAIHKPAGGMSPQSLGGSTLQGTPPLPSEQAHRDHSPKPVSREQRVPVGLFEGMFGEGKKADGDGEAQLGLVNGQIQNGGNMKGKRLWKVALSVIRVSNRNFPPYPDSSAVSYVCSAGFQDYKTDQCPLGHSATGVEFSCDGPKVCMRAGL